MEQSGWIDISQPLSNEIAHWPGDTPFTFNYVTKAETGSVNIGCLTTSVHIGTHIDAPFHVDDQGEQVHELPLDIYIGPAKVVDLTGHETIGRRELKNIDLNGVTRLLLRTRSESNPKQFPENITYLEPDAGPFLQEKGVHLIGVDVPSVDPLDSKKMSAHHSLHQHGIYIVENIVLTDVVAGEYEFIALPLLIQGADGSPVRAIIRPMV